MDFYGAEKYENFRADSNLHSFTTAFGLPQQQFAAFCKNKLHTKFTIQDFVAPPVQQKFLVKLVAMLESWRLYTQPCKISINGKEIFNGELFLENVCKGWPAVYFNLPAGILKEDNYLAIENLLPKKNTIVVERVEILKIALPAVSTDTTRIKIDMFDSRNIVPIYVGMDCDDHRHDESGEMDRLLEHFALIKMGNFVSFRPKKNRNYPEGYPAKKEAWQKWLNFCKNHNIYFQFSETLSLAFTKEDILRLGGENLLGFQFHEPYLVFQPLGSQTDEVSKAKDLREKKDAYMAYLNKRISEGKCKNSEVLCGDPSLLCVYLRETKVDTILAETVSNSSLLFGAARGSGKKFGAHIPIDWYLGSLHDEAKSRRFKLLLNLTYAYGGQYAYAENGVFKTNAFSRNDWEDDFCSKNREILSQFYRFTLANPRRGKVVVPLAVVYGNLESMFWLPDDRIPELIDTENWDDLVWGKWYDTQYRWVWKAIEAWLPSFEFKDLGKNESLTKMFTGTPYGSVDVISPYADLEKYKAIIFLGWNTMDKKIYQNLLNYVKNGGILFICGCHLDIRDDFKSRVRIIHDGKVNDLIGAKIAGPGEKIFDKFRLCKLINIKAKKVDDFLYEYRPGRGKVYFFNFYDYPYDLRLVNMVKNVLQKISDEIDTGITISGEDAKYINYNIWQDGDKKIIYLINTDWQHEGNKKEIVVKTKTKKVLLKIEEGKITVLTL